MHYLPLFILIFFVFQVSSCASPKGASKKFPLIVAVKKGKLEKVREALRQGADPNAPDAYGKSPLHWACFDDEKGNLIKILLDAGAKIDARDNYGSIPLDWAEQGSNIFAIKQLIQKAVAMNNLKIRGEDGKTLLHYAVALEDGERNKIVKDLLALGLDPNLQDNNGRTPLAYAIGGKDGSKDVVITLLLHGAH